MKTSLSTLLLSLALLAPAASLAQAAAAVPTASPATAAPPAATPQVFPTKPVTRPDGRKWRVGYFESGDYSEYPRTLRVTVDGLQKLGWITVPAIPDGLNGRQMWEYLADNVRSDTLEFVRDAWWQPGNFDAAQRPAVRESIKQRLEGRKDIDLIIAMGTWAGQDMAGLGAPVPTIVASTSDAVGARITRSPQDSGLDNLHARVQPERYQRQVRLFHEIVPFKRLGLVYEDSPEGRTYSAVEAVEQVAREQGFKVLTCNAPSNGIAPEVATRNALECYARLAPQIDAAYVTVHRGVTPTSIDTVAEILRQARVPSFSMLGSEEVKHGLLLSLAQADYSYVGLFYAETMARIFNGAKARELSQVWIDPAKIALNLQTARVIGFDPPVDILLAADEVYEAR
ncbi:ABC transporter substrate-binding protein [Achromobacter xylosoxidans]|uniref:ABC transporter substrate-binding protein n=1 Tax=Alcaligenes xylosoxydans xylosoxydans TaxID=85698 RepID=UPI0022B91B2C|nr:ABC transporter substrate binding protein [Achromobacter xylosoxidans]MCZ8392506.1 ABC transporter substrate binding protein [Achromobacter xylosoxidans]